MVTCARATPASRNGTAATRIQDRTGMVTPPGNGARALRSGSQDTLDPPSSTVTRPLSAPPLETAAFPTRDARRFPACPLLERQHVRGPGQRHLAARVDAERLQPHQ